jgi:hypothetical protein
MCTAYEEPQGLRAPSVVIAGHPNLDSSRPKAAIHPFNLPFFWRAFSLLNDNVSGIHTEE